jgi:hypothetical protein
MNGYAFILNATKCKQAATLLLGIPEEEPGSPEAYWALKAPYGCFYLTNTTADIPKRLWLNTDANAINDPASDAVSQLCQVA